MSKYFPLWAYIQKSGAPQLTLIFDEIGQIAGVLLDHSFLKFKKELFYLLLGTARAGSRGSAQYFI